MQVQNLPFSGFGYQPWGSGTPGVASAASGAGASSTGASGSSTAGSSASSSGAPDSSATPSSTGSDLSSAVRGGTTSSASELAVVRGSESLTIQMADGAKVTISMRAQGAAFAAAQTQADGSSSAVAGIFSSGQLQVAASGNLSDADKQAIGDVVSQVNALATQFFSGDVQDAFAAAASLSVDPAEIAGFSLKLSYSSTLIQQASAQQASASSQPGTTPSDNTTPSASTPQQVIINFVQKVMTTLGRGSGGAHGHSHLADSSRWKLHLLAQALPTYAQAQSGAAASQGASPVDTTQGVAPTTVQAPQTASNRYPTLQAAKLAAATLRQLAQ